MDNLNKIGLTNQQQKTIDEFTFGFENHSLLAEGLGVSIVCNNILGRMFLFPEEIEDIELNRFKNLIPIEMFRKLFSFVNKFGDQIREIDLKIDNPEVQNEISIIFTDKSIPEILELFGNSSNILKEQNLRIYILYFLAIEKWFKIQTGKDLSFKGLEIPVGYDDWLGL